MDTGGVYSIRQRSQGSSLIERAATTLAQDGRIEHVAVTSRNPLLGDMPKGPLRIAGEARLRPASFSFVSPSYFDILRIPIVRGRPFRPEEASSEANVAIISAAAAATMWPGADPLGQTIRLFMPPPDRSDLTMVRKMVSIGDVESRGTDLTIVGISSDVMSGLVYQGRDAAHVYMPTSVGQSHATAILVRGRSPRDLRPEGVQETLQSVDANPLAFEVLPLEEALALQMYPLRVASWIGLLLGGIALALCVSGLFGVVTYGLSQRTKEIGIRMALGATSTRVVRLLMAQAVRLAGVGAAIGLVVALAVMKVLSTLITLQNVSVLDLGAFAASLALVAVATALAAYGARTPRDPRRPVGDAARRGLKRYLPWLRPTKYTIKCERPMPTGASPIHCMPSGMSATAGDPSAISAVSVKIAPTPSEIQIRPASRRNCWAFHVLRCVSRSRGGSSTPFSRAASRSR